MWCGEDEATKIAGQMGTFDNVYLEAKLMDSRKIDEYEMTGTQKTDDVYKLMDSQNSRVQDDGCTEEN